jgi:hypothetical protein
MFDVHDEENNLLIPCRGLKTDGVGECLNKGVFSGLRLTVLAMIVTLISLCIGVSTIRMHNTKSSQLKVAYSSEIYELSTTWAPDGSLKALAGQNLFCNPLPISGFKLVGDGDGSVSFNYNCQQMVAGISVEGRMVLKT